MLGSVHINSCHWMDLCFRLKSVDSRWCLPDKTRINCFAINLHDPWLYYSKIKFGENYAGQFQIIRKLPKILKTESQVGWWLSHENTLVTMDGLSIKSLRFRNTILVRRFRYHTLKTCFKPAMSLFSKSGLWIPSCFVWLVIPHILSQVCDSEFLKPLRQTVYDILYDTIAQI